MHLEVDPATHDIVTAEVLLENVHDAKVLTTLLNPLRRKLRMVPMTAKPAISFLAQRDGSLYPASQERGTLEKGTPKK